MIKFTVSFQHEYTDEMVFEVIDNIINPDKTNNIDYKCKFVWKKTTDSNQYEITFTSKLTPIELEINVMQMIKSRTVFHVDEFSFMNEH